MPRSTAGINRTYLSELEKRTSDPGLEIIAKLARVLEVEPAELLRVRPGLRCGKDVTTTPAWN